MTMEPSAALRAGRTLCALSLAFSLAFSLAGCGTTGFAPDSVVENPGADAYLDRVAKACGNLDLGTATIGYLLQGQGDAYFVDLTTKLWYGEITRAKYTDDISAFYPGSDASKAVRCIFGQLPERAAAG